MRRYLQFWVLTVYFFALVKLKSVSAAETPCAARVVEDGIICVCNATYCDQSGPVELPSTGQYLVYSSSEAGDRFSKKTGDFVNDYEGDAVTVTVDSSKTYQKIFGFGGAMTDAAAINIGSLSADAREHLLKSYFSPDGNHYNMLRIPMAGCDFSTHPYSYTDDVENDTTLEYFNLTVEDYEYKIPYIKRAQELASHRLLLNTAPWSAPKWMKTNNDFVGMGGLKTEYYDLWAQYFIKFLEAYSTYGLKFWIVSTQNEPSNGITPTCYFNCMGWSAEEQRTWLVNNLGPTLAASDFKDVKILIHDDQRYFMPDRIKTMLADETARKYTAGIGIHWYTDFAAELSILDDAHESYPELFLLYTEATNNHYLDGNNVSVSLGNWTRGEKYAVSIIETMNHWVTGWTDWNMVLNPEGKPSWPKNYDDAAIIVNSTADEFYKQPMFYVMGHFSKFVPENSTKIHLEIESKDIDGTAFTTPDGATVVILLNRLSEEVTAVVSDSKQGKAVVTFPALSIHTIIWQ